VISCSASPPHDDVVLAGTSTTYEVSVTNASSHEFARPDAVLRYWISGPAPQFAKATVVLLHGATLDHRSWEPQVAALQDRFAVVAPDLRAHGESTGEFSFSAAVGDVEALLDHLPGKRFVLVGLSLGGNIAQEVVRRDPTRVQALVVADATCNTAARHPMEATAGVTALRMQALIAGSGFAQQAAEATATDPEVQAYALEANAHRSNSETVSILASLITTALRPDRDYRLPVPTLLIHGEADRIGDIARETPAWARREPLAEHAVIPAAGHASNLDNPEAFTEKLDTFLLRVLPEESTDAGTAVDAAPFRGDAGAERLYARYGARPWHLLPEATREHFRQLVSAGIDGEGRPLLEEAG
jgi:3-oxoadipate enol-lactonase